MTSRIFDRLFLAVIVVLVVGFLALMVYSEVSASTGPAELSGAKTYYMLAIQGPSVGDGTHAMGFESLDQCMAIKDRVNADPGILSTSDCTPIVIAPKGKVPPPDWTDAQPFGTMAPFAPFFAWLGWFKKKSAQKTKLATIDGFRYRVNENGEIAGKTAQKRYARRQRAKARAEIMDGQERGF